MEKTRTIVTTLTRDEVLRLISTQTYSLSSVSHRRTHLSDLFYLKNYTVLLCRIVYLLS